MKKLIKIIYLIFTAFLFACTSLTDGNRNFVDNQTTLETFEAGAMRVAENAAKDQRQLSENWIKAVANELPEKEEDILKNAINKQKIRTAVVGVNKETGDILFLPIEIENKK